MNRAAYGKERTIVSRRGKDLAAVIPIEDLRLLERLAEAEMNHQDLEDARTALKEAEEKGTTPSGTSFASWETDTWPIELATL